MTNAASERPREVFLFSYLWDMWTRDRSTLLDGW